MIILFSVISFYFYDKYSQTNQNKYIFISWIAAIIASFSSLQGLFVWIALVITMIAKNIEKRYKLSKTEKMTCLIALLTWCCYFASYVKPTSTLKYFEGGIIKTIIYYVLALGGSMFSQITMAFIFGMILLIILCYLLYRVIKTKGIQQNIFPILLILYGGLFIGAIGAGRVGLGIEQGLSSRYVSYTALILIGCYLLGINIHTKISRNFKRQYHYIIIIILGMLVVELDDNYMQMKAAYETKKEAKFILSRFDDYPPYKRLSYFPIEGSEEYIEGLSIFLRENKLSVFYKELQNAITIPEQKDIQTSLYAFTKDNIEIVDNKYLLIVGAWAVDELTNDCAANVFLSINDEVIETREVRRKDVADYYNNPKFVKSGFETSIAISKLKEGTNIIELSNCSVTL